MERFVMSSLRRVLWVVALAGASYGQDYVWIEGERPAGASFEWTAAGVERSELLSGERWLIGKDRQDLPDEGWTVDYDVDVAAGGEYEVWLRVGFEWVRAAVAWRFDEGGWTTVGTGYKAKGDEKKKLEGRGVPDIDRRTTNVKYVGVWNEVAWWDAGKAELGAGKHRLSLRFGKTQIDNPMVALDAIALVRGGWTPEGKLKPGEVYDAEVDRKAARQVYQLGAPAKGGRSEVVLSGLWQVARYDDADMTVDTYETVKRLPSKEEYELKWMGIEAPGDAGRHPELMFGHRVVYRTKVKVPAECGGRAFYLHFSGTNWIVSVFVNGRLAGEHTGVWIPWDLDVTRYVEAGKVNEIALAVKGSYYAYDYTRGSGDLNSTRNLPRDRNDWSRWVAPIWPSTKGDGEGLEYGIVNPVRLVAAGEVYAEDVFVKPSVKRKELVADVTVRNTGAREERLGVVCEAVNVKSGQVEKAFGPEAVAVGAEGVGTVTIRGAWADAKLWWPMPNPDTYRLRTKILRGDSEVDTHEQLFGFREVTVEGPAILINGVRRNFWNWVDIPERITEADDYEKIWRAEGDRFMRMSQGRELSAALRSREERLDYYDRKGMAGRLCSMIDGMNINYILLDGDKPNERVWASFRQHIDQLTKAYRNHPSVIFYQIENELVYINGMNLYGGGLPVIEREMLKVYQAGKANDPTRPYSVGGGGDLSHAEVIGGPAEALEINCPHYPLGEVDWYPDNAYTMEKVAEKVSRWPWRREKPWAAGESLFAKWLEFGTYAGGSVAFGSQDDAARCKAKFVRAVYDGYRWAGVAAFFPWDNLSRYEDGRKMFSELYVIPRKRAYRFYAGRENEVLVKVMNDTLSDRPVTFEWSYEAAGKVAGGKHVLEIVPGYGVEQVLKIDAPRVKERVDGWLKVRVSQEGAEDFADAMDIPVMPAIDRIETGAAVMLLDKVGKVESFFRDKGVRFRKIDSVGGIAGGTGLLVIGPDSLSRSEAVGQDILSFAAGGGRVIVLEQENPVAGGNLSTQIETTGHFGGYAHPQALGTELFRDLSAEDLIDWAGDHPTYKNVYKKPQQGARSLVECGPLLPYSAFVEMATGKGIVVLCQLRVGAKLGMEPAADALFANMLKHYADYAPSTEKAAVCSGGNKLLEKKITETGVLCEQVSSIESALDAGKYRVAVVDATAANMDVLNKLRDRADAYEKAGGWVMLCSVRPESIDGFNRFAGTNHLLRPFRLERVHMQDTDTALAATIGDGDVMQYGTEWIARWNGTRWVSGDTFGYVIDGDDAGPFTYPPGAKHDPYNYQGTMSDNDPYNYVNGMLNSDLWKYIRQIWIGDNGPEPLVFSVRRPETIGEVRIWNNTNYGTIEDIDVIFDDDSANAVRMRLPDAAEMVSVKLDKPHTAEKSITLMIRTWRTRAQTNRQPHLVGIDNVQFIRAKRPSEGVFLDNVGGLVAFAKGKGGVFVNQIKFMADEPLGENDGKKIGLMGTILQNMGVGTSASKVAVPGVNIEYETVDISGFCNRFITERSGKVGWFGRKGEDLARLGLGENVFANVKYHVIDFSTSPVPDCIMLGGLNGSPEGLPSEVKGIKVGRKADVLFFLQAANVTRPLNERERSRIGSSQDEFKLPQAARYVIHYADGQSVEVPVILEKHADHWLQKAPTDLEGAAAGWQARLSDKDENFATIYSMKVNNPVSGVEITSIDFLPGIDDRGNTANRAVPAVLAITTGRIAD
jgi:beta-galactosidase